MGGVAGVSPRAVLARHGRSFHWASRLLAGPDAERCARLYAFCRHVDDLVDGGPPETAQRAMHGLRCDLLRGRSDDPTLTGFLRLADACDIPRHLVLAFLDGVATDLGPVAVRDERELLRYAYGVAGTVGLMMCAALGVRDRRALPFAIDLGVAMQLTNVCRDVAEDAGAGRLYLPRSLLRPTTSAAAIRRGEWRALEDARRAVRTLLGLADRFYRSADLGMRYLPRRARLGILTASRVYEAIGDEILAQPPSAWTRRAVVGPRRKLGRTLRAIGALLRPRSWNRGRPPRHDAALHGPLRALPGADPAA